MAIDKNSKAYQGLLDKGYTDEQIQQMSGAVASGKSAKDVVASTQIQTPATTSTTTPTPTPKSNTGTRYKDSDGYYSATERNSATSGGEFGRSSTPTTPTPTPTPTPVETPTGTTKSGISNESIRTAWDAKSYQQQQDLLNKNPSLRQTLINAGASFKTDDGQTTPAETPTPTPTKTDGWDYQDNSPERMKQIADNVNGFAQTNPYIFNSEDSFRKFFIDGKGRTPEQEAFLMDLYKNMKTYNQLDTYPADKIGNMYAHGEVPDSYLNYLKNSNPDRYNEVMDYKNQAEKGIEDESYYSTILEQAGFTADTDNLKRQTKEGIWLDTDNNGIDDRREHYASEEEKKLWDLDSSYDAELLKLNNAMKDLQSDLTEQYPDADLSTIMLLTSDRGNKIQKAIDTISVNKTKVQGTIAYMQKERQMANQAGADSIAQLQKNLGMYYTYSPEGMSELAQAQYAATNVTLDQADNGTDTQKQMALQSVLDDYYAKYGDIIQRSEAQVINDVMAYAKKNGVSLSQALEENFLKPLRSKPQFATLSSGGLSPTVSFEKVGDTGYIFTVNPDGTYSIDTVAGTGVSTNGYNFTDYTPITSSQLESGLNNFMSGHPLNSTGGQCGSFVNDYLQSLGYDRLYTDPIDKKAAITNTDEPAIGAIAVMDSEKYPEYGHTAIVTAVNGDKVKLLESNWGDDKKVHERWVNKSDITHGYFNPSLSTPSGNTTNGTNNGYDPLLVDFFKKDPTKLTKDQWAKLKNMGYDERTFLSMRQNYLSQLSKEPDDATVKILDTLGYLMTNYPGRASLMAGRGTKYLPGEYGEKMGDYRSYVDYIKQNLTMDNLTKLKANGATFGSLTEGEWPRIEASATRLQDTMSEDKFIGELLDIYNTYAKNAGMGTLTLDDINQMYGGGSSNGVPFNTPSYLQNKQTVTQSTQDGNIDYDARFSEYSG